MWETAVGEGFGLTAIAIEPAQETPRRSCR